ncbi:hypothetical protein B0H19DRAFT_1173502 [Mycena capillaripes]|nr:hypothetical protein B0H19DRAFT_1173502 [Mycena capillaripes]
MCLLFSPSRPFISFIISFAFFRKGSSTCLTASFPPSPPHLIPSASLYYLHIHFSACTLTALYIPHAPHRISTPTPTPPCIYLYHHAQTQHTAQSTIRYDSGITTIRFGE